MTVHELKLIRSCVGVFLILVIIILTIKQDWGNLIFFLVLFTISYGVGRLHRKKEQA